MYNQAEIQQSWINCADILLVRYEKLIVDEQATFKAIINYCGIEVNRLYLWNLVHNNSFVNVTGRKPGQEDVMAHQRKGIAGDWKNYFTDKVKQSFKEKFGDVLIETGYETDMRW
ncbi:MAG: sulfotransferase domain-containing protein [Okeania sp. SIO3B3]|nr:sulfotransferase domain-containing protein [Okeania sp. SIO3B3]